jgi:hypothetical protein
MAFDFLQNSRLSRLFQPQEQTETPQSSAPINVPTYIPEADDTPALDAYRKHVETMPDRANYKTGWLQKVLAGVAGFSTMDPVSAYKTTKGYLDTGYNNDMERYKEKANQLGELAGLEDKSLAHRAATHKANFEAQLQTAKEMREAGKTEAEIRNINDEIKKRGLRTEASPIDGKMYVIGVDGTKTPLMKWTDSLDEGVNRDVNKFGRTDSIRTGNDIKLENVKFEHDKILAEMRADLEKGNASFKSQLDGLQPTQQNAAFELALQQTLIDNPEKYGAFADDKGKLDYDKLRDNKSSPLYQSLIKDLQAHTGTIRNRANSGNLLNAKPGEVVPPKVDDKKGTKAKLEVDNTGLPVDPEDVNLILKSGDLSDGNQEVQQPDGSVWNYEIKGGKIKRTK